MQKLIFSFLGKVIFIIQFIFCIYCHGQTKGDYNISIFNEPTASKIDKNIRSIFQDKKGNYWFGTNSAGVYRYDPSATLTSTSLSTSSAGGKNLIQFTEKDGLSNNQVQSIQEDEFGNIWFGTGLFGVSRFDPSASLASTSLITSSASGKSFTTLTTKENLQLSTNTDNEWKSEPNDLWFYAGGGVYHYNSKSLVYLHLDNSKNSPYNLSRFAVYSILKDKKGNIWFGTQAQGVCRFDPSASLTSTSLNTSSAGGKSFTWFTEKGLLGPAVLAIFEDSKGNIWIGNNGAGLFRYDGTSLINFTAEKGLSNNEFRVSGKSVSGTLARIYAINEDNNGNIWIGTVDSGVWKFDGKNLTNYTTKDGLTSKAVNTIYKDNNGELWFGTDADGICKFNGKTFTQFIEK